MITEDCHACSRGNSQSDDRVKYDEWNVWNQQIEHLPLSAKRDPPA